MDTERASRGEGRPLRTFEGRTALLAAQMAAVHAATMTFALRLGRVETIPQQDSAERAFNKLARTFAATSVWGKPSKPGLSRGSFCSAGASI